jgi:ATP-dependent DNA ligase
MKASTKRSALTSAGRKSTATEVERSIAPMEAQSVDEIPVGADWQYEPKWDGFRAIAFREGSAVDLRSKSGQPLGRYFPEVVEALRQLQPARFVLDGEIVIPIGSRLSFDDLLQRIHPAASRVEKLSREHPAMYVVFDLLADADGKSLLAKPLAERRGRLEQFVERHLDGDARIRLSPASLDIRTARRSLRSAGAALDGVIAKRTDLPYQPGERTGMVKIKPARSADCVVGGFRYASREKLVGSLLLGLYDDDGLLHHVGFTSGIKAADRPALTARLDKLILPPGFTGRAPGGPSRWSNARSSQWQPLKPVLVVEVAFDQLTAGRFRHGTRLLRWRPDKRPNQCTFEQIAATGSGSLRLLNR